MQLRLYIETGNAAFEDHEGREIARILRQLADRLEREPMIADLTGLHLRDVNGNKVGQIEIRA